MISIGQLIRLLGDPNIQVGILLTGGLTFLILLVVYNLKAKTYAYPYAYQYPEERREYRYEERPEIKIPETSEEPEEVKEAMAETGEKEEKEEEKREVTVHTDRVIAILIIASAAIIVASLAMAMYNGAEKSDLSKKAMMTAMSGGVNAQDIQRYLNQAREAEKRQSMYTTIAGVFGFLLMIPTAYWVYKKWFTFPIKPEKPEKISKPRPMLTYDPETETWGAIDRESGRVITEGIPTKKAALRIVEEEYGGLEEKEAQTPD